MAQVPWRMERYVMAQLTLDERFRDGPPTRSAEDRHAWLSAQEQRFILWALKVRWSAARVGRALGVNEATVRRFRKRFWGQPQILLQLGLYEMAGRTKEHQFHCLVCGDRVMRRREVERHVLRHYLGVCRSDSSSIVRLRDICACFQLRCEKLAPIPSLLMT